jgi:hypothetical protein
MRFRGAALAELPAPPPLINRKWAGGEEKNPLPGDQRVHGARRLLQEQVVFRMRRTVEALQRAVHFDILKDARDSRSLRARCARVRGLCQC